MLITGPRHLLAVLDEYAVHYNQHRPHRSLNCGRRAPVRPSPAITDLRTGTIRRRAFLGGLINEYEQAA
jgi:hypothetical protein